MGFLTKEGLQNLTNKLVQGDAIKVASHRGKNVKEVIDNIQRECENVALPNTMTLENRISEFKVGQGRDVDVSGDVEEGKINVELQGKTWQNLGGLSNLKSENFKLGDSPKVLINFWNKSAPNLLKPDTTYTIILQFRIENFIRNGSDSRIYCEGTYATSSQTSGFFSTSGESRKYNTNGAYFEKIKFTTPNNFVKINTFYLAGSKQSQGSLFLDYSLFLEGDHTQTPLEELPRYFEGIKSSFEDGVVDVEVQGKNLFDNSKIRDHSLISFDGEYVTCVSDGKGYQIFNNTDSAKLLKPNKTYYISVNVIENTLDSTFEVQFGVGEGRIENAMPKLHSYIDSKFTGVKKNTGVTQSDLKGKNILDCRMVSNSKSGYIRFKIMITEVENEKFEPYYKKKISFNIGEPLRSLPNGVCDEIRNSNGQWELVRRVGKTILDETYDYKLWGNTPSEGYFVCHADSYLQGNDFTFSENLKNTICDKLPVSTKTGQFKNVSFYRTNPHITVLSSEANSVSEFKTWIAKNPITLYYELQSPIITPIEPMEFDVKPLATMTINSEIAPISTHEVILNRAGQIEQGIELIANLKSRINELENIYDSNLIATQYRIDNLKLNYELEREED